MWLLTVHTLEKLRNTSFCVNLCEKWTHQNCDTYGVRSEHRLLLLLLILNKHIELVHKYRLQKNKNVDAVFH